MFRLNKVSKSVCDPAHLEQLLLPYRLNSTSKGYVLIVNNTFAGDEYLHREGALYDTESFAELFSYLGFTVYDLEDQTLEGLWNNLELFQERFVDDPADCCIVCLMSHGTEGNYFLTHDLKWVNIRNDILEKFSNKNCPQLKGKPKIFFFQCCRGDDTDLGVSSVCEQVKINEADSNSNEPNETISDSNALNFENKLRDCNQNSVLEDMLVSYATIDGYYAYRQPSKGTWYIQLLCSIFKEYADKLDISEMLNLLTEVMMTKVGSEGEKQICPFTNFGFSKKLYLYDRNVRGSESNKNI